MPEASVNEYHGPVFRKNDVRPTGHRRHVKAETEASSVKGPPDRHFRLGVLPTDLRHHSGSGSFVDGVGHFDFFC